jgi:hypothetical protein
MVEICYHGRYDITDLAGQTISIARNRYKSEFGIPDIASSKLNGTRINRRDEMSTILSDDDILDFTVSQGIEEYLIGALFQVLVITGGLFAYDFINTSLTFPPPP